MDDTHAALSMAVEQHIASVTDGDMATDWVLVVATKRMEDIETGFTRYWVECNSDQQPVHVMTGLLRYAERHMGDDDDD